MHFNIVVNMVWIIPDSRNYNDDEIDTEVTSEYGVI